MSGKGTGREAPADGERAGGSRADGRFERAFTDGSVPAAVIAPGGEFLDVNAPLCELTGYSRAEMLARTVPDLIPPEFEHRDMAAIRLCLDDPDATLDLRTRIVTSSGEQTWVHVTSSLVRNEAGNAEFFVAQAVDISAEVLIEEALAESQRRFRLAFEHAPDGLTITDSSGRIVHANPAYCQMLGYSEPELIQFGEYVRFTHPDDVSASEEALRSVLRSDSDGYRMEKRYLHKEGHPVYVDLTVRVARRPDGTLDYMVGLARDITARKALQRALADSEQRFRAAFDAAPVGMALIDMDGSLLQMNAAFCDIIGQSADELFEIGTTHALTHPEDLPQSLETVDRIRSGTTTSARLQQRYRHSDGHYVWVELALTAPRGSDGRPLYIISQILDISEQQETVESLRASEKRLEFQVTHDELTSLPNRRLLVDRINALRRNGNRTPVALLLLDLDDFKIVNDSFGHRTGDELLKLAAQRLRSLVREDDLVCRMGGDEFAVLVADVDSAHEILALAHRMTEHMSAPFVVCGKELFVSASTGIAADPGEGLDAEDLIANADIAMYRAKDAGRCRFKVFDEAMRARIADRQEIDTALRHALAGEELSVHYQPVVDLRSGRAVGCESLLRWNWPGVGLIPPSEFIPVAEDNGVIVPIGAWVFRNSCERLVEWRERWPEADLMVSVNVSGRQLTNPDVVESFASILQETKVPAERVQLELTESVLLDDVDSALGTIGGLRDLGVQLALDDFGTGYSSLTHMQQLQFEVLKLDRSFMHRIASNHVDETIVRTLIAMADALGRTVVAEGVETDTQRRKLGELGCRLAQGFLFARPQAPDSIDSVLEDLILEPRPLSTTTL